MSNSTSDAPERVWLYRLHDGTWILTLNGATAPSDVEYQRVHQQSDLQCVKCGSQMELQHVCEHCGHRESATHAPVDDERLAEIRERLAAGNYMLGDDDEMDALNNAITDVRHLLALLDKKGHTQ